MKTRMAFLIILLLGGLELLHADLGSPDLQAICRVTLKDGTIVEGAILAARGGYQRYWDVNGFYITEEPVSVKSDFKLAVLFGFDFLALEPWTGNRYWANGGVGGFNYQGRTPVVYYLEDSTFQELYVGDTKISERFEAGNGGEAGVLHRTIMTTYIYRLLDFVPVFTAIPDELYLNERVRPSLSKMLKAAPVKLRRIPVKEIQRFELIREPARTWLEVISEKTVRLTSELARCEECEYLFPVWYHKVVKTPEDFRRLLKPWGSR